MMGGLQEVGRERPEHGVRLRLRRALRQASGPVMHGLRQSCFATGARLHLGHRHGDRLMLALLQTIDLALGIFVWILIASAVFSWLFAFNVVNPRNQAVAMIGNALFRMTEPVLAPIRRRLPNLGGIDISPIILLLIIFFIRRLLWTSIAPALVG
jgi:YggT family protein